MQNIELDREKSRKHCMKDREKHCVKGEDILITLEEIKKGGEL